MQHSTQQRDSETPAEQATATPPAWLSDDAKGYWHDLIRYLPGAAIKAADAHAFAMLCNELDTYAKADKDVQDDGLVIAGPMGGQLANPALKIRNAAADNIAKWAAYLQLTPAARATRANGSRGGKLRHRKEE